VIILNVILEIINYFDFTDKSLPRPGRKQVTAAEDLEFHISYL
jgi:hypothetical protein